ncbi:MAG: hypothetical protein PHV06_08300 [bacterium]|nr:hypothetical protein [bacterium]
MSEEKTDLAQVEKLIETWFKEESVGFEKIDKGFYGLSFTVKDREEEYPLGIVVIGTPPVAVKALVELGAVPNGDQWAFFRKMLEMNFSEVISGSFSINESNNKVYYIDRLTINAMTKETLLQILDSIIFAATDLKPKLFGYII